jgi:hypothetical protein
VLEDPKGYPTKASTSEYVMVPHSLFVKKKKKKEVGEQIISVTATWKAERPRHSSSG